MEESEKKKRGDGAGDARAEKRERAEKEEEEAKQEEGDQDELLLPVSRADFVSKYAVKGLSDIYYQPDWIDAKTASKWHRELCTLEQWYRPTLKVYGREFQQSRAIAAFSTKAGLKLKYSGHDVDMHAPFPPLLDEIAKKLRRDLGVGFNHAMLNRYESGDVHIGKHSDNVENKVIVTVSLGAPRSWIMEEKETKERHRWTLANGSLLVMQGDVQRRYTHEIPKEKRIKDSRISITFRQLIYS
ncbi:hypothetical protein FA10DRAFT_286935 [Acaromyces ingoldii]|uniref:Fe2OG dioxygenase domain-containing protein n=1 Tax=Acaromyces ingoldii TaxID=215250 RepID=A0A316YHL4_9BASI|nr:hypothetical protein FA10DRAFT_286935 [Acaromyces ingoldii]PWN89040.1 hypothetical protein FA10DRAFT_286935 [Acaromyces ingoldii]